MQRNTIQRQIVLDIIMSMKHPTVNDVSTEVQRKHPTISKSTVYRNLRQLDKDGIIRKIAVIGDAERYDNNLDPHYHFSCVVCGSVHDAKISFPEDINSVVEDNYPFKVDSHDTLFTGTCQSCL